MFDDSDAKRELRGIEKRGIEKRCTNGRISACEGFCLVGCDHYHLWIDPANLVWMRVRFADVGQPVDIHAYLVWEQREDETFQLRWVRMVLILPVILLEVNEIELT